MNTSSASGRLDDSVGYCTNVHAGTNLASIKANLLQYAVPVRDQLTASHGCQTQGVGLWIPDEASRELDGGQIDAFREFLIGHRLNAFTINGFPFDNFHGDHVKQNVYLPTWADTARLEYTKRLARILTGLIADDQSIGSISTLPIGWPENPFSARAIDMEQAGRNLREMATFLQKHEKASGKRIVVAIEPEPGCVLDTIDDMVDFFEHALPDESHRRYITACHDICHSAVMNESQREVIRRYADAGIMIGKVQVSSAIVADWNAIGDSNFDAAIAQLGDFAEDRYLHQTGLVKRDGTFRLASDLPDLVRRATASRSAEADRWVIHFHVPIFLQRFGLLETTRDAVVECLDAIADASIAVEFSGHLEVETYAWTVLPDSMRTGGLAHDIASELQWLLDQLSVQVSKNRASR